MPMDQAPRRSSSQTDRPGGQGADGVAVPPDGCVRVVLEFRLDAVGLPSGRISSGGMTPPVAFVGWLALMAELSAILDRHRNELWH